MKEVTGVLKMLGSGRSTTNQAGKSFAYYNSIEIGDAILQKVRTAQSLADYLSRGIGEEITLFLNGKMIIGVKLSDGKVYYWKKSLIGPVIGAIPFIPMIGGLASVVHSLMISVIGLAFFYYLVFGSDWKQVFSYQPKLAGLGGIPLKS